MSAAECQGYTRGTVQFSVYLSGLWLKDIGVLREPDWDMYLGLGAHERRPLESKTLQLWERSKSGGKNWIKGMLAQTLQGKKNAMYKGQVSIKELVEVTAQAAKESQSRDKVTGRQGNPRECEMEV